MKDYGNAGALCGALGCMALLLVSMHFAKNENKPDTEKVSAEIVMDENEKKDTKQTGITTSVTVSSETTAAEGTASRDDSASYSDTDEAEEMPSETASSQSPEMFVGPLTLEQQQAIADSIKYSPEVLHMVYPKELSIIGDSIASGFGVYEILDNSYDFSAGSLGARSITDYNFSYDGVAGTYADALKSSQPSYIYLSMGMNDVNIITSDEYAECYKKIISKVLEVCPDSNIIVAGITPVSAESSFAANSSIVMFNEKLKAVVEEFGSPSVRYYDAGSIVMDEATGGLRSDCDGGDGIHLAYSAYYLLLENLYPVLDEMPIPQKAKDIIEEEDLISLVTTEAPSETHEETITETVSVEIE